KAGVPCGGARPLLVPGQETSLGQPDLSDKPHLQCRLGWRVERLGRAPHHSRYKAGGRRSYPHWPAGKAPRITTEASWDNSPRRGYGRCWRQSLGRVLRAEALGLELHWNQISARRIFVSTVFADPCSPAITNTG